MLLLLKTLTPALSVREPIGGCFRFAAFWENAAASENLTPSPLPEGEGADWGCLRFATVWQNDAASEYPAISPLSLRERVRVRELLFFTQKNAPALTSRGVFLAVYQRYYLAFTPSSEMSRSNV